MRSAFAGHRARAPCPAIESGGVFEFMAFDDVSIREFHDPRF
jgi:hypothetical protein